MTILTKTAFVAKYNDASNGLYKAGQVEGIGSNDHRSLVQDLMDSVRWPEDDLENGLNVACSTAQILSANTTPIDLVPAPGADKFNIPLYFLLSKEFGSTPYDTNLEFAFQYEDGTQIFVDSAPYFLAATDDIVRLIQIQIIDGIVNSKIQFIVNGGDPLNGDMGIQVRIKYKTIHI